MDLRQSLLELKSQVEYLASLKKEDVTHIIKSSIYEIENLEVFKEEELKELNKVIEWLTGFDEGILQDLINEKVTFEIFFKKARLNPKAHLIKGLICGYRIEEIDNSLTKQVRYLDKLVDELAKGRKMEKILRE